MTITMGQLRSLVINRDRTCVAAILDLSHECADTFGQRHLPTDLQKLTLEHVKDRHGRRIDHPHHCMALCHDANARTHWGSANRQLQWAYLAGVVAAERSRR